MAKSNKQYTWGKVKPSKVPDILKHEVSEKANALIEKHIRPGHVKPPRKKRKFKDIGEFREFRGYLTDFGLDRVFCPPINGTDVIVKRVMNRARVPCIGLRTGCGRGG